MRHSRCVSLLTGFITCAGLAITAGRPADAAIYASDLKTSTVGAVTTLHYLLNESAVSGSITVALASAPDTTLATILLTPNDLTKGAHEVVLPPSGLAAGSYIFKVNVTAAPHSGYDIITPVTLLPEGTQVGYGAQSNIYPGTLTYGHSYFADFATGKAVHEVNAAGALVQSIAMPATGDFVPVGATVDTNGDLYVSDQNIDHIYRYTPSGDPANPTWTQAADYTGPIVDPAQNWGSFLTRSFQLFGTGADAKAYMTNYSAVPNTVHVATLGDTLSPPVTLFDGSNIAGTRIDQILVTPDEKTIYVSSGAVGTRHLNKFIFGPNPNNNNVEEWYLDPNFSENVEETAVLKGRSRGLAFTQDMQFLWVTQNLGGAGTEGNYIAKVSLTASPASPAQVVRPLQIMGGLAEAVFEDMDRYDTVADGVIDWQDILATIRQPSPAGAIADRIPAPVAGDPAAAVLPVTLDVDVKGNLIVIANTNNTATGTVGNAYYVIAPPDAGSSDTATGPAFEIS